jgi:hypothetical protein
MWGNYGDGHKGVCLKFRSVQNSASVSCLKLRRIVGWSGGPQGMSSIYGEVDHPFERVNYTNKFVEIDFFRSIGHLPMQALMKDWYSDQNGNVSPCADAMMSNETEWRKQYWANFQTMITTKLEDWRHESEYRVILQSSLGGFEKEEDRKLTYRFSDLEGIIFGMNTPMDERLKIINIILEKCKKETRDKFEFHQAYYSPVTGKIETHPLNLLGAS